MVEDDFSLTKLIGDSFKNTYAKALAKMASSDLFKKSGQVGV